MDVLAQALAINNEIIKWRRDLHKIPELGMILPKTFDYVTKKLNEFNIEYTTYNNHSGISAVLGKKEGKTIAIRADMDALEMNSIWGQKMQDFSLKKFQGVILDYIIHQLLKMESYILLMILNI